MLVLCLVSVVYLPLTWEPGGAPRSCFLTLEWTGQFQRLKLIDHKPRRSCTPARSSRETVSPQTRRPCVFFSRTTADILLCSRVKTVYSFSFSLQGHQDDDWRPAE